MATQDGLLIRGVFLFLNLPFELNLVPFAVSKSLTAAPPLLTESGTFVASASIAKCVKIFMEIKKSFFSWQLNEAQLTEEACRAR